MYRTVAPLLLVLALACARKPEPAEAPATPPATPPAPEAGGTPEPAAAVDSALLLGDAELATWLEHVVELGTALATQDPVFRQRYRGTAVSWTPLVSPETAASREELARRHGYASWAAFTATHDKVIGALGLVVARALRAVNAGANMNRIKEIEEKAAATTDPKEKAAFDGLRVQLQKRNRELLGQSPASVKVPPANVDVIGKRQADVTAAFKQLRQNLSQLPPVPPPTAPAAPAPAPTSAPAP